MPVLTISRGGGWADLFRRYGVLVDGEHRGVIRRNETLALEVSHGSHSVHLTAGALAGSPVVHIHIDERGLALACGSNKRLSRALVQMGRPETWIWLRGA